MTEDGEDRVPMARLRTPRSGPFEVALQRMRCHSKMHLWLTLAKLEKICGAKSRNWISSSTEGAAGPDCGPGAKKSSRCSAAHPLTNTWLSLLCAGASIPVTYRVS